MKKTPKTPQREIDQAKRNFADHKERSKKMKKKAYKETLTCWDDLEKELFTLEEIAASELRVSMMIEIAKARAERGYTQRELEEKSGVKQPVIARIEKGNTNPQLETVLKVLAPLGKTLCIVDIPEAKAKKNSKKVLVSSK
jgi:DNA-binding XRE family transcriptional regulator